MLYQFILIFFWLHYSEASDKLDRGYYWRNYNWTIPEDAIPAGKDSNGEQTYIGQAYFPGNGLFVVQIFPKAKEVFGSSYGLKKAQTVIKILCSKTPRKFRWFRTTSQFFHQNVTDLAPVIGGFNHVELHKGMLHIGRVVHHVVVRIGSIQGELEKAQMNYVHGTTIQNGDEFEILLYDKF